LSRYDATLAETITLTSQDGEPIEAYLARPLTDRPLGGVVVLHHEPGYDEASKEYTRRLAVYGFNAICPHLHHRENPWGDPDDAAAETRRLGGAPDERVATDAAGAAAYLRAMSNANGRVGLIGFCSGARQAYYIGCTSTWADAIVNGGGGVIVDKPDKPPTLPGPPPPGASPMLIEPIAHLTPGLSAPLLGLFGSEDLVPSPSEVAAQEKVLRDAGKDFDYHLFDGADHDFFDWSSGGYTPQAAVEGWRLVREFFTHHLATPAEPAD